MSKVPLYRQKNKTTTKKKEKEEEKKKKKEGQLLLRQQIGGRCRAVAFPQGASGCTKHLATLASSTHESARTHSIARRSKKSLHL